VSAEREKSVGAFSVDLVAEEAGGAVVVIENQLERSDHDHLGKLLTYMAGVQAQAAIWVVAHPRPEHVKTIAWLNDSTPYAFYLIQAEAVRIGDSPPAPLLTLIVGPGESKEQIGETKKELAERYHLRRQFWAELLERAKERTKLHSGRSPTNDSWLGTGAGISGVGFNYVIRQRDARIELVFERSSEEENERLFQQLSDHRVEIERTFAEPLQWDRSEGRQMRKVFVQLNGGYRDDGREELQDRMIDTMIRFEAAMRPFVAKLRP
jgi:hypothetical protein